MGDLEESIFQKNVPGKFSTWDRDEVPERGGGVGEMDGDDAKLVESLHSSAFENDQEIFEYAKQLAHSGIPETVRNSIIAERAGRPATGVKVG